VFLHQLAFGGDFVHPRHNLVFARVEAVAQHTVLGISGQSEDDEMTQKEIEQETNKINNAYTTTKNE
jgi:hypothetical protein